MNDEELEGLLREYPAGPSPRVDRALLERFNEAYRQPPLWRRPVPLYQVAASLVLVAGLAVAAGRMAGSDSPVRAIPGESPAAMPGEDPGWSTAAPDILAAG